MLTWLRHGLRSGLSCPCRDQRREQGSSPWLHATAEYPGQALCFPSTCRKRSMDKPCEEQ